MTPEEIERLKNFKLYVFEWDVYVKTEDYKNIAIENMELKADNRNLKADNNWLRGRLEMLWEDTDQF